MTPGDRRWVDVGPPSCLDETGRHVVTIDGCPILLLRLADDIHALRNLCTHLDLPLSNGRVSGTTLMCLHHGARFCITDGRPLGGPAVRPVTVYRTRVSNERIEVEFFAARCGLLPATERST